MRYFSVAIISSVLSFAACGSSGGKASGKMTYANGGSTEAKSCKAFMRGTDMVAEIQMSDKSVLRIIKGTDTTYEYQNDKLTVDLKCSSQSTELQTLKTGDSPSVKGEIDLSRCMAIETIVLKLDC